jgi:hypothetical protein
MNFPPLAIYPLLFCLVQNQHYYYSNCLLLIICLHISKHLLYLQYPFRYMFLSSLFFLRLNHIPLLRFRLLNR